MFKIFDEKFNGFLFVIIFPFLFFFMSYYGFESSYVGLKSMKEMPDFMFSSVYAYRVIPNFLSLYITKFFTYVIDGYFYSFKGLILKNGTIFYHSIFFINSIFFLLSSFILEIILKLNPTKLFLNPIVRRWVHLGAIFFIVMVQYVPTNCDSIAIFFYLLGAFFTLKYLQYKSIKDLFILNVVIFISTFVRETACLNIAFFAAIFISFDKLKKGDPVFLKELCCLIFSFILPYIALRVIIHQEASFFEGVYFMKNFTSPYNLIGLMFGAIGVYFMFTLCDEIARKILKKYIFFSFPYLIMISFVGLFWETRLFLPVILTGIILSAYQFKNIHVTE